MRLIASAAVIASFLLGSNAFIPSSQTRRVRTSDSCLQATEKPSIAIVGSGAVGKKFSSDSYLTARRPELMPLRSPNGRFLLWR